MLPSLLLEAPRLSSQTLEICVAGLVKPSLWRRCLLRPRANPSHYRN